MLLKGSSNKLATGVAVVWIGAALTVLDGVTVRSIVGACVGVETATEAGERPAVWMDASEVTLPAGAAEAEQSETTWENMPTGGPK